MGDRFYQQQLEKFGTCVGFKGTKRRRKMAWTDESKEMAVEMYTSADATPETSMEIVKDIAEELNESPNGVRMILTKAGVYVRKTPAPSGGSGGGGGSRVSVADAQAAVTSALSDAGQEVDAAIISKLTGKAANYFATIINNLNN